MSCDGTRKSCWDIILGSGFDNYEKSQSSITLYSLIKLTERVSSIELNIRIEHAYLEQTNYIPNLLQNMQVQKLYQQAIVFATERHAQKNQKIPGTDLPYVVHLSNVAMELFVASSANDQLNLEFAVQVALLHDLIEDTDTTCEEIESRFGVEIMRAVKALTKNKALPKDQQLPDSIARIKKLKPEVWAVKLADRITNLLPPPSHWDNEKRIQYQREARMILNELKQGNDYLANRLRLEIEKYGNYINK